MSHGLRVHQRGRPPCVTVSIRCPRAGLASRARRQPIEMRASDCAQRESGQADRSIRMQQPESTSSTLTVSPAPLAGAASDPAPASASEPQGAAHPQHRVPRWLERVELFLRVILRMYIGLAICYAPWSHNFWDQNPIFLQSTSLSDFVRLGAVRGIVSGLGLLNLWFAFQDAVRRRDG